MLEHELVLLEVEAGRPASWADDAATAISRLSCRMRMRSRGCAPERGLSFKGAVQGIAEAGCHGRPSSQPQDRDYHCDDQGVSSFFSCLTLRTIVSIPRSWRSAASCFQCRPRGQS